MKTALIVLTLALAAARVHGAAAPALEQRIAAIEDKLAIKQVVDVFSNLADTKEIDRQVLLFTADGVVESFSGGKLISSLKGRAQLKETFSAFLANFHTVYHQNGQQTIDELAGNTAKATSYCRVILIGKQDGKEMKTTMYTIYKDAFVKQSGQWLIKHRISNFVQREVEELK
jgi:ketosteroid isomerase-like protein